jgi:hypothetical protein
MRWLKLPNKLGLASLYASSTKETNQARQSQLSCCLHSYVVVAIEEAIGKSYVKRELQYM